MVLLDVLQVGKILFKNDQNLSDKALKERVLRMYLHGQIPMTIFSCNHHAQHCGHCGKVGDRLVLNNPICPIGRELCRNIDASPHYQRQERSPLTKTEL